MSAGPKGVESTRPIARVLRERQEHERRAGPDSKAPVSSEDTQDAVINISARASELSQALADGEIEEKLQAHAALPVDSRKTAEAIMKKLAPDLYQALLEAGEIEE